MTRKQTLLQRIEVLYDGGFITPRDYSMLRIMERQTRDGLHVISSALGLSPFEMAGLNWAFVVCRAARRHRFPEEGLPYAIRSHDFGIEEEEICERCSTHRFTVYTEYSHKKLTRGRYVHPDGYSFNGRAQDLTSADLSVVARRQRLDKSIAAIEADPKEGRHIRIAV